MENVANDNDKNNKICYCGGVNILNTLTSFYRKYRTNQQEKKKPSQM